MCVCSAPQVKSPSITVYPLFTLFYLPQPPYPFPLVTTILLSVPCLFFLSFTSCFCLISSPFSRSPPPSDSCQSVLCKHLLSIPSCTAHTSPHRDLNNNSHSSADWAIWGVLRKVWMRRKFLCQSFFKNTENGKRMVLKNSCVFQSLFKKKKLWYLANIISLQVRNLREIRLWVSESMAENVSARYYTVTARYSIVSIAYFGFFDFCKDSSGLCGIDWFWERGVWSLAEAAPLVSPTAHRAMRVAVTISSKSLGGARLGLEWVLQISATPKRRSLLGMLRNPFVVESGSVFHSKKWSVFSGRSVSQN